MSPAPKANREPLAQAAAEKKGPGEYFTALYATGVERLAEVQKKSIDLAVAQNAELTDAWKKVVHKLPGAPGLFLLDLASSAFERYADTRKGAIDAMVEQSHALTELTRERTAEASKAIDGTVSFFQQSMESSVAMQKTALDHSAAHTKTVFDTVRQQFGFSGGSAEAAATSFHRGIDTVIDAQKELLDIAVH